VVDSQIKEDMVVKIAILAENFASSWTWYVDVIVKVLCYEAIAAGSHAVSHMPMCI
jgi:hypothetical protein